MTNKTALFIGLLFIASNVLAAEKEKPIIEIVFNCSSNGDSNFHIANGETIFFIYENSNQTNNAWSLINRTEKPKKRIKAAFNRIKTHNLCIDSKIGCDQLNNIKKYKFAPFLNLCSLFECTKKIISKDPKVKYVSTKNYVSSFIFNSRIYHSPKIKQELHIYRNGNKEYYGSKETEKGFRTIAEELLNKKPIQLSFKELENWNKKEK